MNKKRLPSTSYVLVVFFLFLAFRRMLLGQHTGTLARGDSKALLERHREVLEAGAIELLAHETLDEPSLATLRDRVVVPAAPD